MDYEAGEALRSILGRRDADKVPSELAKKIEKYITEKCDEHIEVQALYETLQRSSGKKTAEYEKLIQELNTQKEDNEVKLEISQQSVTELRKQLDDVRADVSRNQQMIARLETENIEVKRQRDTFTTERDALQSMLGSRSAEIERLKCDLRELEKQLTASINAKYEAIQKYDSIQAKEASLEFKERRMEQDKTILTKQLQTLTETYNTNMEEVMAMRRERQQTRLSLEAKLNERADELKIAESTIAHLRDSNQHLQDRLDEVSTKRKEEADELIKMVDCYKNELMAKTKLADICKSDSEDSKKHVSELSGAVTQFKKMLDDAVKEYGELETRYKGDSLQNSEDLKQKDSIIDSLKIELKNANDLLKAAQDENLEHAVERFAPAAAATSKIIKSGMTLTEIYSEYVRTAEKLRLEERERSKLEIQLKEILQEIEERAPEINKRTIDFEKMLETNTQIKDQMDNMITDRVVEREHLQEVTAKYAYLERENKRLKCSQSDLSRQVCFLLKEIEQLRGGIVSQSSDTSVSSNLTAGEVISKNLVTFTNIDDLHEKNQKLLLLVRDMTTRLEDFEKIQSDFNEQSYEAKINDYAKRLENMEKTRHHQAQLIQTYIQQRDRYKLLYFEIMKDVGKPILNASMDGSVTENMDVGDDETANVSASVANVSTQAQQTTDRTIAELNIKLKDAEKALQTLKEEHNEYRKEKMTNDKIMNDQFNSMRSELRDLTTANCKLKNNYEFKVEKIKSLEKDVADAKKQISALEERNKIYDKSATKQEQEVAYMRDELFSTQKQLSISEVTNKNLKQQYDVLRDSETRLQSERESLYGERQKQNIVLNNLEMLKCTLERSENEGRARAEHRLDDAIRECSALRRQLQEEQDRFRELSSDLERKMKSAVEKANAEKAEVEQLQETLKQLRQELADKTGQIEMLSQKLQEALTPNKNDNPVAKANKRAKELQVKLDLANVEVEHLKRELDTSRTTIEQYENIAKESEIQLNDLTERYNEYRTKTEKDLQETKTSETNLLSRVAELETEIKLQINDARMSTTDTNDQLMKTQQELKDALEQISLNNRLIRDLREQVNLLSAELKSTSDKYTKVISLHTSDLQAYTDCKEKLSKIEETVGKLRMERDEAVASLKESQDGNVATQKLLVQKNQDLESRLDGLNAQNTALHEQLQLLSTTVTTFNAVNNSLNADDGDVPMNESTHNDSILNRSITDTDGRDKLMSIIKYLRTEKDVALANVDVLRSENVRLSAEMKIMTDKVNELTDARTNEVSSTEENPLTLAKYTEVLRKMETLSSITDSNRMLRDELSTLRSRVKEISDRNSQVENEIFPLQEQTRELTSKNDELTSENTKLRTDVLQWRQRANALVERSNKNPEEFKRMQNERANLARMLTVEKEKLTKADTELNAIKQEKARIEAELANLSKTNQSITDEKRKLSDEILTMKQKNSSMTDQIIEIKGTLLQRDDEIKKMVDELNNKEGQLNELINKELQIRKIAKKYKDLYFELKAKVDKEEAEKAARPLDQQAAELGDGVNASGSADPNSTLRTEYENVAKQLKEAEAKYAGALKELNSQILTLTEDKIQVTRELTNTKTSLLTCEQNRNDFENNKFQNESRINRLEKDMAEQDKENKETIARLTRDNEALQTRVSQLQRSLGMQQGTKPTTSSGSLEKSPSDPARTANVKPMAGPSPQQSASVTPRRGGDTPLASIRPMSVQNSRTAAVLPTSQTTNVASIHGSSSSSPTGTTLALVPPQQQVHTTGATAGEVMSTTSSAHCDYMPATSSAASVAVAAVPPMANFDAHNSDRQSQEAESVEDSSSSTSTAAIQHSHQDHQAVAMVSPRQHENAPQNIVAPQQAVDLAQAASTSASSSTSAGSQSVTMSTHNRATSTSNTVTTSQAGHKRPRDIETDSTEDISSDAGQKKPQTKRTRVLIGSSTSQGVSESSCLDVDYQVTTSSQRDQDDENILIVDSDDDDEMPDDGPVEPDDTQFEDNGGFEEAQPQEVADAIISNNEVDVDDSSEIPNQSENLGGQSLPASGEQATTETSAQQQETQQIQMISASDAGTSQSISQAPTRQLQVSQPQVPQQTQQQSQSIPPQAQQQQQQQQNLILNYEETSGGDGDSIVPSTPTLFVSRRADGFSEVSSPQPMHQTHQQQTARFTFGESTARVSEGMDDTRIDLTQLDESGNRNVATVPSQSPRDCESTGETSSTSATVPSTSPQNIEDVPGTSSASGTSSSILIIDDTDDGSEFTEDNASTTETEDTKMSEDIEDMEEEGLDGVSSEGEKTTGGADNVETEEEGREAEVATTYQTRSSRGGRGSPSAPFTRRGRPVRGRQQPIVWQDGHNQMTQAEYQQQGGSPNRPFNAQQQQAQQARGQRRRMRRPYNTRF